MVKKVLAIFASIIVLSILLSTVVKAKQGCCSWHKGVCGCSGGRQLCCDGTLSPSCTCYSAPPPIIKETPTSTPKPTLRPTLKIVPTFTPTPQPKQETILGVEDNDCPLCKCPECPICDPCKKLSDYSRFDLLKAFLDF